MSRPTKAQIEAGNEALRVGFEWVERTIKHPDAFPDFMVILPFNPEFLSRVFTKERMRLWAELQRSRPKTLTELAGRLGRNVSRVRQDVLVLTGARLASITKVGNQVRAVAEAPNILIAGPTKGRRVR